MIQISVVIITLNEEKNLERCLQSVSCIADEIVVVDSLSTDKTVEIAKRYGAKIVFRPFLGYVAQKNFANEQATYDWVFSIDADEALSPELEKSILKVKKDGPKCAAYRMARLTNYCGQWIKHSGWYPDRKMRLIHRKKGYWKGEQVHEYWFLPDKDAIGTLNGDLLHYSYYTISEHIRQTEKYSEMAARAAVEKGKNCSMLKVLFGPKWVFFNTYFIRLGFLDGYYGYLVCKYTAYYSMIKYSKTRQYAHWKKEGKVY